MRWYKEESEAAPCVEFIRKRESGKEEKEKRGIRKGMRTRRGRKDVEELCPEGEGEGEAKTCVGRWLSSAKPRILFNWFPNLINSFSFISHDLYKHCRSIQMSQSGNQSRECHG
jgi:hypothetical protein